MTDIVLSPWPFAWTTTDYWRKRQAKRAAAFIQRGADLEKHLASVRAAENERLLQEFRDRYRAVHAQITAAAIEGKKVALVHCPFGAAPSLFASLMEEVTNKDDRIGTVQFCAYAQYGGDLVPVSAWVTLRSYDEIVSGGAREEGG